jgi:GNAT superfamily N-acetyltransferase
MITLRLGSDDEPQVALADMTDAAARQLGPAFAAMEPWSVYPMSAEAMTAYFSANEPGAPRFVIRVGDEVVGAVGLRLNWMRGPYLQVLGVLPEWQGDGVGKLVLTWFELAARARGDRNLWVAVSDFNPGAARFYNRFGFKRVADLADLIRDGKTEILLRKPIHAPNV